MARIRQVTTKDQLPSSKGHIFDAIAESRGRVAGPFSVLLNSPEAAGRIAHLGTYLRFESRLFPAERELAILTTSREFDCDYEWSAHEPLARRAGVRDEAIGVIASRGPLTRLTKNEAIIVRYGRELFRKRRVSDRTFEAAKARLGEQGVTELTATMGYYAMLACALNAFQVEPAPGTPRLP
jgi:4-carboxymuconolactone decarboxylase